jgi:imidazolonepropionase-like amidohydrolase
METQTIINARIFDGERVLDADSVVIGGGRIRAIGERNGPETDARGGTLLPGFIDAHTHTTTDNLKTALRFGVTTELEMTGFFTTGQRKELKGADVRSALMPISPPGGHPSVFGPVPTVDGPEAVVTFIADLVAQGADYVKIMVEEGTVLGVPGLPQVSDETIRKAVTEAHRHNRLAIAHAMTTQATERAVNAGVDGLAHLFMDRHTPDLVKAIRTSGAFVTPCLALNSAAMGINAAPLAADRRVSARLDREWLETLEGALGTYPQGDFDDVIASAKALHEAGVDLLAGTDSGFNPGVVGGVAHGASLHHELQLLVRAGLSPAQALRAATALPARRFGLTDRGRIAPGLRADLVLVDGDPTADVGTTLNLRAVWRAGVLAG